MSLPIAQSVHSTDRENAALGKAWNCMDWLCYIPLLSGRGKSIQGGNAYVQ